MRREREGGRRGRKGRERVRGRREGGERGRVRGWYMNNHIYT